MATSTTPAKTIRYERMKDVTREAWDDLKDLMKRAGFEMPYGIGFNDLSRTHRRIKVDRERARFLVDNLAVWAVAEKHQVNIYVVYDGGTHTVGNQEDAVPTKSITDTQTLVRIWLRE